MLTEGFASYMQTYIINKIYPEWQMNERFIVDTQNPALKMDALESTHAIQVPIKHAEEVEEVFDMISYLKGASVVRFAYATLGENNFLKGLQSYMDKHKYSNTVTKDLWAAWEDASGLPVAEMMSSWTKQVGFPLVTVVEEQWKPKEGKCIVTLEQQRFLADGSLPSGSANTTWSFPLFVSTKHGTVKHPDVFMKKRQKFEVKVEKDDKWLKLNGGQNVPLRVNYSADLWERLIQGLERGELKDNCDQTGLLLDARALAEAGKIDPVILLRLLSTFKKEESYHVWGAISSSLNGLGSALVEDKELSSLLRKFAASIVRSKAEALGWSPSPGDDVMTRLLRSRMVNMQCSYDHGNKSIQAEAARRFKRYVANPLSEDVAESVPPDIKVAIFRLVLRNPENANAYEQLRKVHEKVETNIERRDIYNAIGAVPSMDLKVDVLDWATSGEVATQDFTYLFASVATSGTEGLQLTFDYFKENFGSIHAKLKSGSPFMMNHLVSAACGGFASEDKATEIKEFFEEQNVPDIKRTVAQIVEATKTRAKFAAALKSSSPFREYLAKAV